MSYISGIGDTCITWGLREKWSTVAGRMVDLRRELDKLQADPVDVDGALVLYGLVPEEIPAKGQMPVRSAYFGRNEINRRWRDLFREKDSIRGDEVTAPAMRDKGLDPGNRKLRAKFTRRILVSLHRLAKAGTVEKAGHGRGVRWNLRRPEHADAESPE